MLHAHLVAKTRPAAREENIIHFRDMRITVLSPRLFRIEQDREKAFCDEATQAVWFRDMPPVSYRALEADRGFVIATEAVRLTVCDQLTDSFVTFPDGRKAELDNGGNLLGTYRTLDRCDGDELLPRSDGDPRIKIELGNGILSRSGAAVYDDSASLLLGQNGEVKPRPNPETDLYVFAFDRDYRAALRALYDICGAPPVLPRYAFGNWWSRYWAYTQREYLSLMASFADRNLPFTVATVDMDWHPSKNLPNGERGWTGYTWNEALFPDYRAFLRALHEMNMKVTLNLHPALGVRWFEKQYPEMAKRLGIDPDTKEPVPFNIADTDFINAYFDVLHKPYEREGVDFWWVDWQQGTKSAVQGLDPLWSLNHYHSLDIAKEHRQLILSRYAGIGSHRYPVGFSGDTLITWKTLQYLPYFTATASNAGYTWWSHDIGGHWGGIKDDELFVRFVQFGVFSPINRLHNSDFATLSKDAGAYKNGRGLIAAEYLRLRHAMIPFLYTAACETAEHGQALVEPMYYGWPDAPEAYDCAGQYFFGQQLIAAPIAEKSGEGGWVTKRVWLPEGRWTDAFTGDVYPGGGWREMTRPLDSFPLLAKEGGFFVLDGKPDGNSVELPKTLKAMVFSGSGEYTLIEDTEGGRAMTVFRSEQLSETEQNVTIRSEDPGSILPGRTLILSFRNVTDGTAEVTAEGEGISFGNRLEADYTIITIPCFVPGKTFCVRIRETADARTKQNAAILRIVSEIEGDNPEREKLYASLCRAHTKEEYEAAVRAYPGSALPKKRLLEIGFDPCGE